MDKNYAPKTLAALRLSIEHWRRIETDTMWHNELIGAFDCDLCRAFLLPHMLSGDKDKQCIGCPVMTESGMKYCDGTPFRDIVKMDRRDDPDKFFAMAKKEREYLESLLP